MVYSEISKWSIFVHFSNLSSYIPEPSPISKSDKYESEEVYRMLYEVQMLRYHLLRNGDCIEN